MWFGTFGKNRGIQFVFSSLTVLFWLLAIRDWTGSHQIGVLAGYEGIICGLSAIYVAMAEVLNEVHGKVVLPLGEVKKPEKGEVFSYAFLGRQRLLKTHS
jgi:hypothetical protein